MGSEMCIRDRLEIVSKVIGWIIQVLPIFIILRPRPRTYAFSSPLLLLQLHHQQQVLSIINIINSTNHHLQHAKLRILLQHLTSRAAYERGGGPPQRPAAKRPCILSVYILRNRTVYMTPPGRFCKLTLTSICHYRTTCFQRRPSWHRHY